MMEMALKPLTTNVSQQQNVAVIELQGEIDIFSERTLTDAYAAAENMNTEAILLDFSKVDYINSTGIALIVSLLARAQKTPRCVLTCGLSDHYKEIFKITRLADFLQIYPDEAAALADFNLTKNNST
jgi:anti-sigma B factor antagonist